MTTSSPNFYLSDSRNYALIERYTQNNSRRIVFWGSLMMLIVLIFGLISFAAAFVNMQNHSKLMQSGVTTEAQILQLYVTRGRSSSYYVSFSLDNNISGYGTHRFTQLVSPELYSQLEGTQTVKVVYLPPDLSTAEIAATVTATQQDRTKTALFVGGALLLIPLLIACVIFSLYRRVTRVRMVDGSILTAYEVEHDGDLTLLIRFAFQTPKGRHIEDVQARRYNPLHERRPPSPGTAVMIAFIDDKRYTLM